MNNRGFTYIEILMAIVILAFALIPLLSQFYIGFHGNITSELTTQAIDLANDLMEEIKSKRFDENIFPDDPVEPALLGIDPGEILSNRRTFDDIDDYNNWSKSPPETIDGIVLNEFSDFTRSVNIEYVTMVSNTWQASSTMTYYKKIVVKVSHPKIKPRTLELVLAHF